MRHEVQRLLTSQTKIFARGLSYFILSTSPSSNVTTILYVCRNCRQSLIPRIQEAGVRRVAMKTRSPVPESNLVAELEDEQDSWDYLRQDTEPSAKWDRRRLRVKQPALSKPVVENGLNFQNDRPSQKDVFRRRQTRMTADETANYIGNHLQSYESFMAQANVEILASMGTLLVDTPDFKINYSFWVHIIRFRARVHKEAGIKAVWKGMRSRQVDIPVKGAVADELWMFFVRVALDDKPFFEELWLYVKDLHERKKGRKWHKLYEGIVGGLIEKDPERALRWHSRLTPSFWSKDSGAFFRIHAKTPDNLPTLWQIHILVKKSHLYPVIIPYLCNNGHFELAKKWHKLLFARQDLPSDTSPIDDLVRYMAHHDKTAKIRKILVDLHSAGVVWNKSTSIAMISCQSRFDKLCKILTDPLLHLKKHDLGDDFWALVLSYRNVKTHEIEFLMEHFETETLGAKSMEEFVKRQTDYRDILKGFSILKSWNHTVGDRFRSRVLQGAILTNDQEMRTEAWALIADMQITDHQTKEAMLEAYLHAKDWKKFYHVHAKLSMHTPRTWNYLIQSYIAQDKITPVLETLERMRMRSVHPNSTTICKLFDRFLAPRWNGRRPPTNPGDFSSLNMAIGVLQSINSSGGNVPPKYWREILKRLGMTKRLNLLEHLCFWLVHSYSPDSVTSARRNLHQPVNLNLVPESPPQEAASITSNHSVAKVGVTSQSKKNNPLRKIFAPNLIKAFVDWGFLDTRFRNWSPKFIARRSNIPAPDEKLLSFRFTWGIYLTRVLKEVGVPVDEKSIIRAVRLRMRAIYGDGHSDRRSVLQMSRKWRHLPPSEIVRKVEEVWGGRLFCQEDVTDRKKFPVFIGRAKSETPSTRRRGHRLRSMSWAQKRRRRRGISRMFR